MADFSKLDRLLERFAQTTVPSCSCAVMQHGKLIYSGAKGEANLEQHQPADTESVYRQASMTKLFTYTILGMLYEEGQFLFTDPISDFLPEWKESCCYTTTPAGETVIVPTRPITIRDAVTMTCGLPYCMAPVPHTNNPTLRDMSAAIEPLLKKGIPTLREEVRAMAQVPLAFAPGEHWLYGFGSEIAGAVVEEIAGKPLREVFQERLIAPLGLAHTDTFITQKVEKHLVTQYFGSEKESWTPAPKAADAALDPAITPVGARAHLLTTAEDYVKFMSMLACGGSYQGERFLSRKTIDLLRANHLNAVQMQDFTNPYLAGYGYGLGFRTLLSRAEGEHNGTPGAFGWTGGAGT